MHVALPDISPLTHLRVPPLGAGLGLPVSAEEGDVLEVLGIRSERTGLALAEALLGSLLGSLLDAGHQEQDAVVSG